MPTFKQYAFFQHAAHRYSTVPFVAKYDDDSLPNFRLIVPLLQRYRHISPDRPFPKELCSVHVHVLNKVSNRSFNVIAAASERIGQCTTVCTDPFFDVALSYPHAALRHAPSCHCSLTARIE
eukprot:6179343-Pleurochrysis_carterae.AAC.1